MGHKISKRDQQTGTSQAWHGKTRVEENIEVDNNYLTEWDVERRPLTYVNSDGVSCKTGFDILVSNDDEQQIGRPISPHYKPITNKMFLDLVSDAMNRMPSAKIESVGSVCNRGKVFVTVSLQDHKTFKAGHREFNDFLNFGNSHDQTSKLWINNTNICTVCDNTFNYNLHDTKNLVGSTVHRGDIEVKLADMSRIVDVFLETQEDFKIKFTNLLKKNIDKQEATNLFAGFLTRNSPSSGISPQCLTTINSLNTLFVKGRGNRGESYADAFSAVTDYYTHNSTRGQGKNIANQYVSSEFGLGKINKQRFWSVINDDQLVAKTIERGTKLLSIINK